MIPLIEKLFIHTSWYIITLLMAIWMLALVRFYLEYKAEIKTRIKSSLPGLIVSAILAVIIFVSVPPALRVLNDEVNLLSVSRSMTADKTAVVIDEAIQSHGVLDVKSSYIDKRPLLFPYLVSILHTFLGYRIENVFILNFVVLLALLSTVTIGLRRYLGSVGTVFCALLIVSHPIVSLTAASGVFDLFAATFMVICLANLWFFLKRPSAVSFQLLWLNCILWSNIRYECFVYFAVILVLLAVLRCLKWAYFRNLWLYALTPVFFIPLVLQRIITQCGTQVPEGDVMFSLRHFAQNNVVFFKNLFRFDFYLPYANIVILLAVVSFLYVLYRVIRPHRPCSDKTTIVWSVILFAVLCANWVIVSSYYHPIDDVVTCRFYIPFCVVSSFLVALAVGRLGWFEKRPVLILLLSIFIFALYHPVAVENRMFKDRAGYRRNYEIISNYFNRLCEKDILIIAPSPKQLIVNGFGAIGFRRANANPDVYLDRYRRRLFENIYVVQEVSFAAKTPEKDNLLTDEYQLSPVYEMHNRNDYFLRISKVTNSR